MVAVHTLRGPARSWFLLRLKAAIFLHFLPEVFAGSISPRQFVVFLKRMLLFLAKLQHNKYVTIGGLPRLDLYVPNAGSPAFHTACRKFLAFARRQPCTTVLLSVTAACRFRCPHCYQRRDGGHDVGLDVLLRVVRQLQANGIAFFNIEGGEPFLVYDRLKQVCAAIDARSEIWVNSTGDGMTLDRLRELQSLNLTAIMFSLHTADPRKFNAFMKSDAAWDTLTRGVELCHQANVPVAFNACVAREDFYTGDFERIMDQAKEFNAVLIQLIKPKPAGAWLESGAGEFTSQDMTRVRDLVQRYNHDPVYADYPAISAQIIEEDPAVFGCTAGGTDRFYINAKGDVQPCEFLNLSFGNLLTEDFGIIYDRMRQAFDPPGETWLCEASAPTIRRLIQEQRVNSLPLSPELSQKVCQNWDRGQPTALYADLKKLR